MSEKQFKVVILGDSGVGKTSILHRIAENSYTLFDESTGIEIIHTTIDLDGKKIKLQLWDTRGQEDISATYIENAKGVLIVYDITRESSFENLNKWMALVRKLRREGAVMILLGSKCDLRGERMLSRQIVIKYAKKYGMPHIEVSAPKNINILMAFKKLARDMHANAVNALLRKPKS